ncbi:hypothetical protein MLD38_010531 [Melastoma candidum]|uniref:Uncharacterized protein n=1 Tax=Melastoma candidum TaxID=119954 RepID=A0ACB9R094_9MYRT|nr:hypothetical protein MLD38_010531 [Melastoma candidum]
MNLLNQLWDDTVAGPTPDNGLGRLRKFRTFSPGSNSGKEPDSGSLKSFAGDSPAEDAVKVTRSIMIVKPPGYQYQSGSPPVSPAGSTPPASPFSGSNRGSFRFRRRSMSDAYERPNDARRAASPPPRPYDV